MRFSLRTLLLGAMLAPPGIYGASLLISAWEASDPEWKWIDPALRDLLWATTLLTLAFAWWFNRQRA